MISRCLFPFIAVVCLLFVTSCNSATYQVQATVETDPVHTSGDGADDTAIWLHPDTPEQSLIAGTDKGGGLIVYNLAAWEVLSQMEFLSHRMTATTRSPHTRTISWCRGKI